MNCGGCGNKEAYRISATPAGESCDKCAPSLGTFHFADVYFKGPGFEPHLADPEKSPKGNFVTSRSHKAQLMRDLGVKEVGDKLHGARDNY